MDDAIRIESRPVLLLANRQRAPDAKLVGGRHFVSISKWNRGFARFMTGKALDLRKDKEGKSGSVDSPVIDNILEQRQNSANELLLEALTDFVLQGHPAYMQACMDTRTPCFKHTRHGIPTHAHVHTTMA